MLCLRFVVVVLLGALLASCGGGSGGDSKPPGPSGITINITLAGATTKTQFPAPVVNVSTVGSGQAATVPTAAAQTGDSTQSLSSLTVVQGAPISSTAKYNIVPQSLVSSDGSYFCLASPTSITGGGTVAVQYTCSNNQTIEFSQRIDAGQVVPVASGVVNLFYGQKTTLNINCAAPTSACNSFTSQLSTLINSTLTYANSTASGDVVTIDLSNHIVSANNSSLPQFLSLTQAILNSKAASAGLKTVTFSGLDSGSMHLKVDTAKSSAIINGYWNSGTDQGVPSCTATGWSSYAGDPANMISGGTNNDHYYIATLAFIGYDSTKAAFAGNEQPSAPNTLASSITNTHANGGLVFVSVGGADYPGHTYSADTAAIINSKPTAAADDLYTYLINNNYDGVDIDIEAATPPTTSNFEKFLDEMFVKMRSGKYLYITLAPASSGGDYYADAFNYLLAKLDWFGWVQPQLYSTYHGSDTAAAESSSKAMLQSWVAINDSFINSNPTLPSLEKRIVIGFGVTSDTLPKFVPPLSDYSISDYRGVMGWDMFWDWCGDFSKKATYPSGGNSWSDEAYSLFN